jgi:hypothetical protein
MGLKLVSTLDPEYMARITHKARLQRMKELFEERLDGDGVFTTNATKQFLRTQLKNLHSIASCPHSDFLFNYEAQASDAEEQRAQDLRNRPALEKVQRLIRISVSIYIICGLFLSFLSFLSSLSSLRYRIPAPH